MRTELNDRFEAFFREWGRNRFSEDVVSADELMRLVTHPVLELMSEENHRRIFHDVASDKGRTDIVHHCLGSYFFSFIEFLPGRDSDGGDSLAAWLHHLYDRAVENHGLVLQSGGQMAIKRAEDRAIAALLLTETCFSKFLRWYVVVQEGETRCFKKDPYLLPAQLYYIATGQLVRPPQNREDINVVETVWQSTEPQQMLGNLERMSILGLKIHDYSAFRIFTDSSMNKIAQGIVQHYINKGETILSKAFLCRLEDFEDRTKAYGVRLEIRQYGAPFVLERNLGQAFVQAHHRWRAQRHAQQNVQNNAQVAQNMLQGGFDGMNLGNQNAGGQGPANQLNQNNPYEETKDQGQGPGKR